MTDPNPITRVPRFPERPLPPLPPGWEYGPRGGGTWGRYSIRRYTLRSIVHVPDCKCAYCESYREMLRDDFLKSPI